MKGKKEGGKEGGERERKKISLQIKTFPYK